MDESLNGQDTNCDSKCGPCPIKIDNEILQNFDDFMNFSFEEDSESEYDDNTNDDDISECDTDLNSDED